MKHTSHIKGILENHQARSPLGAPQKRWPSRFRFQDVSRQQRGRRARLATSTHPSSPTPASSKRAPEGRILVLSLRGRLSLELHFSATDWK